MTHEQEQLCRKAGHIAARIGGSGVIIKSIGERQDIAKTILALKEEVERLAKGHA